MHPADPRAAPAVRLLGPVTVDGDPIGSPKASAFLAGLALHANRVVPVDRLVDALWPLDPPKSALANIRTHAHRLRRLFGDRAELSHRCGGYELAVPPELCDHLRFEHLARAGRAALGRGDPRTAADLLAEATGLWHGDRAAIGVDRDGPLGAELTHLDEERLRAAEDLAETWLHLGEVRAAVREARTILRIAPARTRGWSVLLRGHHALGEHSLVGEAYEAAAAVFRRELDLAPDPELTRLRDRLLGDRDAVGRDTFAPPRGGTQAGQQPLGSQPEQLPPEQ